MRSSRSNPAASPAPTQSAFRFRRSWLVLILALVAIAAGAWYGIREWNRSADRQELLQAARGSSQDIPERLNAYLAREPDDAEMVEALVDWQLRAAVPYSQMEPNLDRLCTLRPNDVHAFRVRASFRGRSGRLNEALADGLRALELDPTDDITRRMVSNIAAESGQFEIAVRELTRLLDSTAFPRNDIAAALVRAQLQAGDAAHAEETLAKYLSQVKDNPDIQSLRCRALQVAGKHEEAIAGFRKLADSSVDERESALYYLAESQRALNRDADLARTLAELDQVKVENRLVLDATQQPENMEAQIKGAEILLKQKKATAAAATLERAVSRLGKSPAAAKLLSQAYREIGRLDLAAEWDRVARQP